MQGTGDPRELLGAVVRRSGWRLADRHRPSVLWLYRAAHCVPCAAAHHDRHRASDAAGHLSAHSHAARRRESNRDRCRRPGAWRPCRCGICGVEEALRSARDHRADCGEIGGVAMGITRRAAFKGLALGAATVAGVKPATAAVLPTPPPDAVGLLYDATLCIGCKTCVVACQDANGLPRDPTGIDSRYDAPV